MSDVASQTNFRIYPSQPEINEFLHDIEIGDRFFKLHCPAISIKELNVVAEYLPAKVRGLVQEWAEIYQQELLDMWLTKDFHKINPLVLGMLK